MERRGEKVLFYLLDIFGSGKINTTIHTLQPAMCSHHHAQDIPAAATMPDKQPAAQKRRRLCASI